jgi:hypothetical protein
LSKSATSKNTSKEKQEKGATHILTEAQKKENAKGATHILTEALDF